MSINKEQFVSLIIRPVLTDLQMWSLSAENLILGTLAVETDFLSYLKQYPSGPGWGPYSQEELAYNENFTLVIPNLRPSQKLILAKYHIFPQVIEDRERLFYDLRFATIMTRLQYWRYPEPLPKAEDIEGLAHYWKKYYNTHKGDGTVAKFKQKYKKYVGLS